MAIALALVSKGESIIEVGANIGTETVYYSDIVGPQGNVYAFEPFPPNFSRLLDLRNLSINNNLTLYDYGLSNKDMKCDFVVPGITTSGIGHIKQQLESSCETIEIKVTNLDSLLNKIGQAKLIAIDIEGEEINFLEGAKQYLREYKPYLIIEASPKHLKRSGASLKHLYDNLISNGYNIYQINRFGLSDINNLFTNNAKNWFCIINGNEEIINKINQTILYCTIFPSILGFNPLSAINE